MIIIDKKIPYEAKSNLKKYENLLELETSGIVYEAISGHPDIFFTKIRSKLIVSPSLPEKYFGELKKAGILFKTGEETLGKKYPATVKYNCVEIDNLLIHNFRHTDSSITNLAEDHDLIHVDQAYTRCNLIPLGNKRFITSDNGIKRTLERFELDVFYQDPEGIILPGHKNGFIGGCVGIKEDRIFFIGKLEFLKDGEKLKDYIFNSGFEIIELYDGQMFDGGSVLFV